MLDVIKSVDNLVQLNQQIGSKGEDAAILSNIAAKLYNTPNPSDQIVNWFNKLIVDYNRLNQQEKTKYNGCLFSTFHYFLPFIAAYEKLYVMIQMCCLVDDEDEELHAIHFNQSVCDATLYSEQIHFKEITLDENDDDNYLIYLLGYFNFRVLRHEDAIKYFEVYVKRTRDKIKKEGASKEEDVRNYIRSAIYLAKSHEFCDVEKDNIPKALEVLLGQNESQLLKHVKENHNSIIRFLHNNYMAKSIIKGKRKSVLDVFKMIQNNDDDPLSNHASFLPESDKCFNELVHVVAHCLSEYASLNIQDREKSNEIKEYSLLQLISRFFIDWLVIQDNAYVTCQATIRAENNSCPEAISILLKRLKELKPDIQLSDEEKRDKAELQFYLFYFSEQELLISNNKEQLIDVIEENGKSFNDYAESEQDIDAQFHYLVIRFSYLLKKYTRCLLLENNNNIDYSELDDVYFKINKALNSPLTHVFHGLKKESSRLLKAYELFREYRYLYCQDFDIKNIREFCFLYGIDETNNFKDLQNKMRALKASDSDWEAIVKEIIDNIEKKKRILILAPVKQAPSCSEDYLPIEQLPLIKSNDLFMTEEEYASCGNSFYSGISDTSFYYSSLNSPQAHLHSIDINKVKWAIFYDMNYASILSYYYADQETILLDNNRFMLSVKIDDNPRAQIQDLFQKMSKKLTTATGKPVGPLNCNQHDQIHSSNERGYVKACSTRLIRGKDVIFNPLLLELFSLIEFEFYTESPKMLRIQDDDKIVINTRASSQSAHPIYKIFCLESDALLKNGPCTFCTMDYSSDEEHIDYYYPFPSDSFTIVADSVGTPPESACQCKYNDSIIDIHKLLESIQKFGKMVNERFGSNGAICKECEKVEEFVENYCCCGKCNFNLDFKKCRIVMNFLRENKIDFPTLDS